MQRSKMNLIFIALLITAACAAAYEEELTVEGLTIIIEKKCQRKSGEAAFNELGRSIDAAMACLYRVNKLLDNDDYQEFCEKFTNSHEIYECVTQVGEKLKACLDEEEAYLPDFLYGAFNHTLKEFCGPGGQAKNEHIRETIQDDHQCFEQDFQLDVLTKTCFPELAIFKSANNLDGKTFVVKESEICSDMVNFQTCVTNSIKEQCDKDYSKFVYYLMEPYLSWCAKKMPL